MVVVVVVIIQLRQTMADQAAVVLEMGLAERQQLALD
jgi:hypothetical protein